MDPVIDWQGARIPVFSSLPSKLNGPQAVSKGYIYQRLRAFGLDPRTVGGSDLAIRNPLHEVRTLARHCAGGIILGYSQVTAERARRYRRLLDEEGNASIEPEDFENYAAPTPWNQLETGILFGLGLPLFVLRETSVAGGIFDEGSGDVLVHPMPMPSSRWEAHGGPDQRLMNKSAESAFDEALLRWQGLVRAQYYGS